MALSRGEQRLRACFEDGIKEGFSDDTEARIVILSYPVARMMAASLGRQAVVRHALGEADAALRQLSALGVGDLSEISKRLGVKRVGDMMVFTDYVRLCADLARKSKKWKLVNRDLSGGLVRVTDEELPHLLRQAIAERVAQPLDVSKVPKQIRQRAGKIRGLIGRDARIGAVSEIQDSALAPCMKSMLAQMRTGQAGHQSMFVLASFLSNLGLSEDDILEVFAKSPKFDREKASYQLGYITGRDGGTQYTCPACSTLRAQGLCVAECGISHPLKYYSLKSKKVNKRKKE